MKVYYEPGKFLVLGTVLTCFLLYLVAIITARKADNNDKAKVIQLYIHGMVHSVSPVNRI